MSSLSSKSTTAVNPTYTPQPYSATGYRSFRSFYPYYLGEHSNATCRRLHLVGTTLALSALARATLATLPLLFILPTKDTKKKLDVLKFGSEGWKSVGKLALGGVMQGYVWAWIGHFFFEKNKPATFKHPFYSFLGDLRFWAEVVMGKRRP